MFSIGSVFKCILVLLIFIIPVIDLLGYYEPLFSISPFWGSLAYIALVCIAMLIRMKVERN